jgi:RNA polymerase sigma factor for flagellar operon FliA
MKSNNKNTLQTQIATNESLSDLTGLLNREERTPEENFILQEQKFQLTDVIKSLQPRDRVFISLYYYENLTYKDISEVLNCSISNIAKVHQKILATLKERLSDESV